MPPSRDYSDLLGVLIVVPLLSTQRRQHQDAVE